MNTKPAFIYEYAASLFPGAAKLIPIVLSPLQRKVFGGHLYAEAPRQINLLGTAMAEEPAFFSHIPIAGQDLLDQQERARAWKQLRNHLSALLTIANDAYLSEQGGAIAKMQLIIDQLEAEQSLPFHEDPLAREREYQLQCFYAEWKRRQKRIRYLTQRSRRKNGWKGMKKMGKGKGMMRRAVMQEMVVRE